MRRLLLAASLLALAPARAAEIPAAAVRPGSDRASRVRYEFEVDPGVELLAAVVSLARPAAGGARPGEFAALKDHPAVKRLKAELDRGVPEIAATQLLLSVGEPPELAERGPVPPGLADPLGGAVEAEALLADLRGFARAAGWTAVWAGRRAANARLTDRAREETRRTLSPDAVEAWFGTRFRDRCRIILSDDLPSSFGCNTILDDAGARVAVRMRSAMGRRGKTVYFSFDEFAGSAAHELTHTFTDPMAMAREKELEDFAPLMIPGCTDSWTGCVMEHVNLAATLRALRAESGDAAYRATLDEYVRRGFPYLPALCARLEEFEAPAVKARGFEAFYPRVVDVFREALRRKRWPRLAAYAPRLLDLFASAPARRAATRETEAQKLTAKGMAAYLAGDAAGAAGLLREAQKLAPDDAEIALNLGVSLGKAGDAGGEAAEYDRAISLGLSGKGGQWEIAAAALSARAETSRRRGRRDAARADLQRALSIAPAVWIGRADLLKRLDELEK